MQTQPMNRILETNDATPRSRNALLRLHIADGRIGQRKVSVAIPIFRRESCMTKRAVLAALREAELEEWSASGGDFLASLRQSVP